MYTKGRKLDEEGGDIERREGCRLRERRLRETGRPLSGAGEWGGGEGSRNLKNGALLWKRQRVEGRASRVQGGGGGGGGDLGARASSLIPPRDEG